MARPEILYPLFAGVETLPGVGPRLAKAIERLTGGRVVDLLWLLPTGLTDRRPLSGAREARVGEIATLTLRIAEHGAPRSKRAPYRVFCEDEDGAAVHLVFFNPRVDWLLRTFPPGETRLVSGRAERFDGVLQIAHPDIALPPERAGEIPDFEPVYPLTQGLPQKTLGRIVGEALARAPGDEVPEWLDAAFASREAFPPWRAALEAAHRPDEADGVDPLTPSRRRLAYDELLANQLALALMRAAARRRKGRALTGEGGLRAKAAAALPYELTAAQAQAIAEIAADMGRPQRMMRLLQGDVGAGKTAVALMALLIAVEAGAQGALMAPTEILARQHFAALAPLAEAAGAALEILTGRDKGSARHHKLTRLASGEIDILIGTHALFSDDVAFRDLGLAVVDEQHRFGVHQRLALADKGGADLLVMTATPIPRTLALTAYGDLEISALREKPPGRKPIQTVALPDLRLEDVVARIRAAIEEGRQAYWVCPLVEESDVLDATPAEARFAHLADALGPRVGLVHGRMKAEEKDRVMADFLAGEIALLVATTVIEVGVDVPNATIMVIERAERFGLAQIHQLRGRVGRGEAASTCVLLYGQPLGETARARIETLRRTEDGFEIAEKDLQLRGAGDVLGVRQSGMPEMRLADLSVHGDLLECARDDARLILATDPGLEGHRGDGLRLLLYLFERDAAVRYLRIG